MPSPLSGMQRDEAGKSDFTEVPASGRTGHEATVSIALPSSILSNAQSPELRMYLVGQIARAVAIYCIDEVVVFKEREENTSERTDSRSRRWDNESDPTSFFKLVLEYLETPQFLRKHLFPVSREFRLVGLLNPLGLPSHVSKKDCCRWREGIAVGRMNYSRQQGRRASYPGDGKDAAPRSLPPTRLIDVGLERLVEVDCSVTVGDRVTVDMEPSGPEYGSCPGKYLFGRIADRAFVRRDGLYWGYKVRVAESLSAVFRDSEVATDGYDVTVGTSERGTPISGNNDGARNFELPAYSNLLIVFGGVQGLEKSVLGDLELEKLGISSSTVCQDTANEEKRHNVSELFDFYVNTCPAQGSRTIRTEEALLVSLAALQPYLRPREG